MGYMSPQALPRRLAPPGTVFIETPRTMGNDVIADRAANGLAHAAQLGATVSREPAASVVAGLAAHLETAPADHLVIGRPGRSRWRSWLAGGLLPELLARFPHLTVHVAPAGALENVVHVSLARPTTSPPLRGYVISTALALVTIAACELLRQLVGGRPLSLLLLLPVITAAARFGLRPAALAVATCVISFDLLSVPVLSIDPLAPVNIVLWFTLSAVAIYTSMITSALRSRVALSDRSAQESARIVALPRL